MMDALIDRSFKSVQDTAQYHGTRHSSATHYRPSQPLLLRVPSMISVRQIMVFDYSHKNELCSMVN